MSDHISPDWSLLPGYPLKFFGLPEPFTRDELKKAYNRLLRVYKPEKYPAEFQKLRAAYDQLEARLRYSGLASINPDAAMESLGPEALDYDTTARQPIATGSTHSPQAEETSAPNELERWNAMLEKLGAAGMYQQLSTQDRLTPREYILTAILSDAVATLSERKFFEWLLKGLREYPSSNELLDILRVLIQENQLQDDELYDALVSISQVISNDNFYFLTERLWDRLILSANWDVVDQAIVACEKHIRDHQVAGKVAFTCHLLRRALWLASSERSHAMLEFVESHPEYLHRFLEYDVEFNWRLQHYLENRTKFLAHGPYSQMIDEGLKNYCLSTNLEGDNTILACHIHIAGKQDQVLEAFPVPYTGGLSALEAWLWASEEVLDRTKVDDESGIQSVKAVAHLLDEVEASFAGVGPIYYSMWWTIVLFYYFMIFIGLGIFGTNTINPRYDEAIFGLAFVALSALFQAWLKPRFMDPYFHRWKSSVMLRNYNDWARDKAARFHAATHLQHAHSAAIMERLLEEFTTKTAFMRSFVEFYRSDLGMLIYAAAVRFSR